MWIEVNLDKRLVELDALAVASSSWALECFFPRTDRDSLNLATDADNPHKSGRCSRMYCTKADGDHILVLDDDMFCMLGQSIDPQPLKIRANVRRVNVGKMFRRRRCCYLSGKAGKYKSRDTIGLIHTSFLSGINWVNVVSFKSDAIVESNINY